MPAPLVPLNHLDHLWFQVAGTLCNLECRHCFISSSPHNHAFGFLSLEQVRHRLAESVSYGVKEYYFTGGEPFLNRELVPMLVETLRYGPATVLTNGTVLRDEWLLALREAEDASPYSLEFRVSIDGATAETNDVLRGRGSFELALAGVRRLVEHGFLPIVTAAPMTEGGDALFDDMLRALKEAGVPRPRIKILPSLRIGAETRRGRGYHDDERVTAEMLDGFDTAQLLCEHSRIVTDRGVHVCPILIDAPESLLGQSLAEAARPFAIVHGACSTCYQHGAICANPSSVVAPAPPS